MSHTPHTRAFWSASSLRKIYYNIFPVLYSSFSSSVKLWCFAKKRCSIHRISFLLYPIFSFSYRIFSYSFLNGFFSCGPFRIQSTMIIPTIYKIFTRTVGLSLSKNTTITIAAREIKSWSIVKTLFSLASLMLCIISSLSCWTFTINATATSTNRK